MHTISSTIAPTVRFKAHPVDVRYSAHWRQLKLVYADGRSVTCEVPEAAGVFDVRIERSAEGKYTRWVLGAFAGPGELVAMREVPVFEDEEATLDAMASATIDLEEVLTAGGILAPHQLQ